MESKAPARMPDTAKYCDRKQVGKTAVRSILCVPLLDSADITRVIGTIEMCRNESQPPFSDGDVGIMKSFAGHATRLITTHLAFCCVAERADLLNLAFNASRWA